MAHQTDVHVVHQSFEPENPSEKVTDPVCGAVLERRRARHIVFRPGETAYFCSRKCRDIFLDPVFKHGTSAQAARAATGRR